tara:strand:- start:398 stop:556 length:159 start_codon:yes stop_codon:yes gene_type:complete
MARPKFLYIGVQKGGTTILFEILNKLPNIFLPVAEEAHFFKMKSITKVKVGI